MKQIFNHSKVKLTGIVFLFYRFAVAQLPVDQEQHHKVLFSNENIRVIDLVIAPGDTTLMHSHTANSVVIFLSASELVIQNADQGPVATTVIPGTTVYRNYGDKPVLHKVWINDKSIFRCIVIEQQKINPGNISILGSTNEKAIFSENWVTAYQIATEARKEPKLFRGPCFLIAYSGQIEVKSSGRTKTLRENEFIVCTKGDVKVMASKETKFILLELL